MDRGRVDAFFSTSLQENTLFQPYMPSMRVSTSHLQGLPLQQCNIQFQPSHPSTSTFQGFAEVATQRTSSAFRRIPRSHDEAEISAFRDTYKLIGRLARSRTRSAFNRRQVQQRPRYCWKVKDGVLRASLSCPLDCKFHRMNLTLLMCRIKYDTNLQHYRKAFDKLIERLTRPSAPKLRPRSEVDDLNRMMAESHIDERNEVEFEELMEKMVSCGLQDGESDEN